MLAEPFANDRVEDNVSPRGQALLRRLLRHALLRPRDLGRRPYGAGGAGRRVRLADVFRKAGFTRFRRAADTPFNLILEARL